MAKKCRMGPYFIPPSLADGSLPSKLTCSWYAPGASGGVNIDGGAAVDPETGMMYVASITGMSTTTLAKDQCSEFDYSSIHDSCGQIGALPKPANYKPLGRAGGFEGRSNGTTIGGVSIVKPKEHGGITAYNMNTGDKSWWIPNAAMIPVTSTDPLFAGVKLPSRPGGGQAQVITTKTLVIYGTGRSGGAPAAMGAAAAAPQLFATDKATGKQVGAVRIPAKTTAVPMTFMHKGKQYIVFATGQGGGTSLVALTLPEPPK